MAYVLGDPIDSYFRLKDVDGLDITGGAGDVAVASSIAPSGGSFGTIVVVETATLGTYKVTFTPTGAAGTYYLALTHPDAVPGEVEDEWDVDPVTAAGAVTTVVAAYGVSLQRLRRDVGRRLGDLILTEATATGSTVTFHDAVRLVDPALAYKNRLLLLTAGTAANVGEERRVVGSTSSGILTLQSALPEATAPGDEGELWNDRGQGWGPEKVKDLLNQNIRNSAPLHLVELTSTLVGEVATPTATLDATVDLPAEYQGIYAVEYADWQGNHQPIRGQHTRDGRGFRLEPGRKLVISGRSAWDINGGNLKLFGYGYATELADDDDTTTVNAEWLVERTRADLMEEASFLNRLPEGHRDAARVGARADALRGRIRTIPKPNTVWVR
jgi:hypothetical protein